jgi:hypothetical protein
MLDTDKFHIDAQGPVEMFLHQLLDIAVHQSSVIPGCLGQRVFPLSNTSKKHNILAREVMEGGEILK